MDGEISQAKQAVPRSSDSQEQLRACPACGLAARRVEARFCLACGRALDESYLPADALRASYNLQYGRIIKRKEARARAKPGVKPLKSSIPTTQRARNSNGASTTALAFVTFALVPYLGILFCPGALLMGGVGLYKSYRTPELGGRRASYVSLTCGLLIFCGQIFLWWILYKIPEWTGT